jgi:hypothetical protein
VDRFTSDRLCSVACFERAGPSDGPWATNALPGQSWHQYGEAVDCFLVDAQGHAVWESRNYARFGAVGDAGGIWWGGHFGDKRPLAEPPHRAAGRVRLLEGDQ